MPVSVRAAGDRTANNQVSAMIAELPVGISDPIERLHAIRSQMATLKESHQAVAGSMLVNMAGFAPPALLSMGVRTAAIVMRRMPQRSVNTVTTNVPLSQGVRTGVAILSYNGKISFGVTGDWDAVPDVAVLADGIETGMQELLRRARRKVH